jgi:hypothetical protein
MMSRVVVPSQNQHFILSHLWPRTQIHLSVIENYSFSDKDGGEPGDESKLESADEEDKDEADVPEEEDSENDDDVCGVRTMVSSLDGKVACELSKNLYGVDQWWFLLLLFITALGTT